MNAPHFIERRHIANIAEQVNYNPETGIFTRRHTIGRWRAGSQMGGRDAKGYVILKIGGRVIKAHRLAWFVAFGKLPCGVIDHINGDPADNRLSNLRDVNKGVNNLNSWKPRKDNLRSGLQGVTKISGRSKRWAARITRGGKRVHLGSFATPEEAHAHYLKAKRAALREALNAN